MRAFAFYKSIHGYGMTLEVYKTRCISPNSHHRSSTPQLKQPNLSTNMQFQTLFTLAVAAVAAATPTRRQTGCSTGPIQCCNSVQNAGAPAVAGLLGLLGIVLQDVNVPVGLTCSPISVIGVPGNSWYDIYSFMSVINVY